MKKNIKVKEVVGENYSVEDAIVLRDVVSNNLDNGVELDFDGIGKVSTNFLNCLFTDLINKVSREYIFKQIDVKKLSNYSDYSRVVLGTSF